jgi:hypothetical protein
LAPLVHLRIRLQCGTPSRGLSPPKGPEGTIAGHDFQALVFREHAANASFELGRSRISKLWLRERATRRDVAAFERGWDMQPTTPAARTIVDLLCAGLAEIVHGK